MLCFVLYLLSVSTPISVMWFRQDIGFMRHCFVVPRSFGTRNSSTVQLQ
nr:unnamed protein product [Callosobruchus analis]